MKNLLTVALVIFLAGAFTSCKKDYTCSCDITILGTTQTAETLIADSSKGDATDACDKLETEAAATAAILAGTATCTLN